MVSFPALLCFLRVFFQEELVMMRVVGGGTGLPCPGCSLRLEEGFLGSCLGQDPGATLVFAAGWLGIFCPIIEFSPQMRWKWWW